MLTYGSTYVWATVHHVTLLLPNLDTVPPDLMPKVPFRQSDLIFFFFAHGLYEEEQNIKYQLKLFSFKQINKYMTWQLSVYVKWRPYSLDVPHWDVAANHEELHYMTGVIWRENFICCR